MTPISDTQKFVVGAVAVVVAVAALLVSRDSVALKQRQAEEARVSQQFAQLVDAVRSAVQSVGSGSGFGGAGDTFTSPLFAQINISTSTATGITQTNTVSTTFGSLYNGGRPRYIKRLEAVSVGSSGTFVGGSLIMDFSTSTSAYTSSTNPIASVAWTTSTMVYAVSSTPNTAWKRVWNTGEYLNCSTNRIVSSTSGYCQVEYSLLDL